MTDKVWLLELLASMDGDGPNYPCPTSAEGEGIPMTMVIDRDTVGPEDIERVVQRLIDEANWGFQVEWNPPERNPEFREGWFGEGRERHRVVLTVCTINTADEPYVED